MGKFKNFEKLELGKTYKNYEKELIKIVKELNEFDIYKFLGDNGHTYTIDGLIDINSPNNVHNLGALVDDTNTNTYTTTTTFDIKPEHYKMEITPIEFIIKNNIPFIEGNVIKYICRYKQKNGKEDLLKAKQYIDFLLEQYGND